MDSEVKKNKGGRPPAFTTEAELSLTIEKYLHECKESDPQKIPNKAGFCVYAHIHRDTYNEYKKKEQFSDTLKRLESIIEEAWIQRLSGNSPTGAIFYLKNAFKEDYKDKQETDITTKGDKIVIMPAEIINKHHLNGSA